MLIPNTLFYCVLNERGTTCFPYLYIPTLALERWRKRASKEEIENWHKNRNAAVRKGSKKFWNNKKRSAAVRKKMSQKKKEYWSKKTKEERSEITRPMLEKYHELRKQPVFGKRMREISLRNLEKINGKKKIIKDIPRINTYSGVITSAQMESLD